MTSFPSFLPSFSSLLSKNRSTKPTISSQLSLRFLSLSLPPTLPPSLSLLSEETHARARARKIVESDARGVGTRGDVQSETEKRRERSRFERWRSVVVENRSVRGRGVRVASGCLD